MTSLSDNVPVAFDLVPDPAEPNEMRGGRRTLIADEEIGDSRVVVTQLAAERLPGDEAEAKAIVAFDVTFHADRGNRFVSAKLTFNIASPPGTTFIECQPRETVTEPVEVATDENGNTSLGIPKVASVGADVGRRITFTGRHRVLSASGAGTPLTIWTFEEDPHRDEGILHQVNLVVTIPAHDLIECVMSIAADLARPGVSGSPESFRRMIFGARRHKLSIEIPPAPPRQSRFWFGLGEVFS